MEKLNQVVFYAIDKAIKSYRQMAQKNINKHGLDITIDQWLLLTSLRNNPDATQQQIAEAVFKDYASITRMIEILVQKQIIVRHFHPDDRRRSYLEITSKGLDVLTAIDPVIQANRSQALDGILDAEIEQVKTVLQKIASNCK
ncbi:MAG TPA: MarR family transcriptional regulator [Flavobacterium sp.]|nr:MarR family transcriptional regulator [Flavobacterium sp.]HPJ11486.1 MarR family transcriptional regulator [Flavobacterium sp.]